MTELFERVRPDDDALANPPLAKDDIPVSRHKVAAGSWCAPEAALGSSFELLCRVVTDGFARFVYQYAAGTEKDGVSRHDVMG